MKPTTKTKMDLKLKQCKTPEFRVSFPHVFEPHSGFEGQEAKYSITMLFPKNADLSEMKKAAFNAAVEKFGPKENWPKKFRLPFRDGNEKSDQTGYADTIFVSASCKGDRRPGVVAADLTPITKEDNSFYAGCYARATLTAFAYDTAGNKGVSFGLNNIQKLRDGQPFSGRKRAEDDFEAVSDGSDDQSNYSDSSDEADAENSLGI